ncbi:MAG: methyltransferase domain-containing protein [Candidatus Dojkabacteria bacterium]|nr:methyltransferase domain-containing protein [Candidatus Dojkabacteria bacterium]
MSSKLKYTKAYDSPRRFISYYYQCEIVINLKPKTVLEVGVGNKTVSNYLKEMELDVKTCDIEMPADYKLDVREMSKLKDDSFDVVIAYEILEHIPWEDLDKALLELRRVSKKYVVISVPWTGWPFNINIQTPIGKDFNLGFWISRFFANMKPRNEHCWEIGFKNYPLKKIRNKLKEYFRIEKDFRVELNRYHHFFILSK